MDNLGKPEPSLQWWRGNKVRKMVQIFKEV